MFNLDVDSLLTQKSNIASSTRPLLVISEGISTSCTSCNKLFSLATQSIFFISGGQTFNTSIHLCWNIEKLCNCFVSNTIVCPSISKCHSGGSVRYFLRPPNTGSLSEASIPNLLVTQIPL